MLYLIFGENSYQAIRKIRELKESFKLKGADFLLEEVDGEAEGVSETMLQNLFLQANLFGRARFIILKNILAAGPDLFKFINKHGDSLRDPKDIFLFWEKDLKPKTKEYEFFEKYAAKIQETKTLSGEELARWLTKRASEFGVKLTAEEKETMLAESGESGEWALENTLKKLALGGGVESVGKPSSATPSPFVFVERMFGPRALLALKEMTLAGIDPSRFIYALLWKIKQKKMTDAYFRGIQTESQMRRDPKNSEEILERFIFFLRA